MRRLLVFFAVATFLVLVPGINGLAAGPVAEPGQKGPFAVGFTSYLITDPARPGDGATYPQRPIPVYVWYPVDQSSLSPLAPKALYPLDPLYSVVPDASSVAFEKYGIDPAYQAPPVSSRRPFPLLVFSPGLGAPAWMHTSLAARLASHGFVVAVLYHYGDQWWPWEPPYDYVAVSSFNRPLDVSFALTDLLERNGSSSNPLFGSIRPNQVAAGGWSLGGYAAMVLAGGDDSVCDALWGFDPTDPPLWTCAPSFPDPRIKAILPLDGSGWILHFDELSRISVPACGLGQEWSYLAATDPGFESWGARQHAAYQGHPAYRVDVANANHQSFSDLCDDVQILGDLGLFSQDDVNFMLNSLCAGRTPSAAVHALVGKYAVAFLKTNLVGESGYQNILTPGWALTREQYAEFFVTEKRNPHSIDEDWPGDFVYFPHQPGSVQARAAKDPKTTKPIPRVPNKR